MAERKRTSDHEAPGGVRLDKWLWAARFFKTRALAVEAIAGGRVELNGEKTKRAKPVRIGGRIRVRLGPYQHHLTIRGLSERRGPAAVAAKLYQEDEAGKAARLQLAGRMRQMAPAFRHGAG